MHSSLGIFLLGDGFEGFMKESFGSKYSRYYDVLYSDKDYRSECEYLLKVFKIFHNGPVRRILDISCGAGGHSLILASRGYEIDALDSSEEMLAIARAKGRRLRNIRFHRQDMRSLRMGKKYDACLSVFGSLNYVVNDNDLERVFRGVAEHVEPGGIFVFDVWYGPAVLSQKPELRVKDVSHGSLRILRVATPLVDYETSTNRTTYKILVLDRGRLVDEFSETHLVRYLFVPEVESLMRRTGFKLVSVHPFMFPKRRVTINDWNVSFVGRRVGKP